MQIFLMDLEMKYMVWERIEDVPANIRTHQGVPLGVEQANKWAEIYDAIVAGGDTENPAAVAWATWNKLFEINEEGNRWISKSRVPPNQMQEFEPPESGDAPEEVKSILASTYTSCRTTWVKDNPNDTENDTNKESCSKIAWSAVEKAGWKKDETGKWIKIEDSNSICPECKDQSCTNTKMFSSCSPKLYKLSEGDEERTGASELLLVFGTAIAEGEWKDVVFEEAVVMDALERATNLRIDVEHEDVTWDDVKGFSYKPRWNKELKGIDIDGAIFDERVINWHRQNPNSKVGFSVKLGEDSKFETRGGKKYCTYLTFKGLALTLNPACKVCWVNEMHTVELSSSDKNKTDGGINKMADDKKTPEQLAAEEKLAADKKIADEKLEAEKKLAEEKAKETEQKKQSEDAATAKLAAANSSTPPTAPTLSEFNELKARVEKAEQANKTLSNERSLSEVNAMVSDLIQSGELSEAKRESATKTLLALSSNEDRAAFLNTIGGNWEAGEKGLVLSEKKDEDGKGKKQELEFSEPERKVIT